MTEGMTPDLRAALEQNAGFLRGLARSLVRDPELAEDVAQDVWVAALAKPPSTASHLRGWLAAVARNLAFRSLRARERRARRELSSGGRESVPPTEDVVARGELARRLVVAVMALPEPYRITVLKRYFDGASSADIARSTGESESTVRVRLKRALDQLRARLDQQQPGGRDEWKRHLVVLLEAPAP